MGVATGWMGAGMGRGAGAGMDMGANVTGALVGMGRTIGMEMGGGGAMGFVIGRLGIVGVMGRMVGSNARTGASVDSIGVPVGNSIGGDIPGALVDAFENVLLLFGFVVILGDIVGTCDGKLLSTSVILKDMDGGTGEVLFGLSVNVPIGDIVGRSVEFCVGGGTGVDTTVGDPVAMLGDVWLLFSSSLVVLPRASSSSFSP